MSDDRRDVSRGADASTPPGGKIGLALVAAWLVPGLGHVVVGRWRRGLAFGILVLGSFALGLMHDGRLAMADRESDLLIGGVRLPVSLTALQVVANLGVGPVDCLARLFVYGEPAYVLPRDHAMPSYDRRVRVLRERTRSVLSIYGTAYLWTAGLMNLLLLFDVWDLTTGRKS